MDIVEILKNEGYKILEGYDAVLKAITSDEKEKKLCSGYGVFPDGTKCVCCQDCQKILKGK